MEVEKGFVIARRKESHCSSNNKQLPIYQMHVPRPRYQITKTAGTP